ncbi:hypothetical protein AB6A40_010804 [Gnathostoma spinigerum]|uniref:Uncharacterized protein n=1 Tax=Gnathostoma spinigerum TaxID=75299 RepID=A0ABD6EVX9_9BILA
MRFSSLWILVVVFLTKICNGRSNHFTPTQLRHIFGRKYKDNSGEFTLFDVWFSSFDEKKKKTANAFCSN